MVKRGDTFEYQRKLSLQYNVHSKGKLTRRFMNLGRLHCSRCELCVAYETLPGKKGDTTFLLQVGLPPLRAPSRLYC